MYLENIKLIHIWGLLWMTKRQLKTVPTGMQQSLQLINALHRLLLQLLYHHSPNIFIHPEARAV